MGNTLSEVQRQQLQAQAKAAGLPYATILAQHLYDLQGLEEVLTAELTQAKQGVGTTSTNSATSSTANSKIAEVTRKLTTCQAEITAYNTEQQQATHS